MIEQDELVRAFVALRDAWFNKVLKRYAHPRQGETEVQERYREKANANLKVAYDEDTNAILAGEKRHLYPTCEIDLGDSEL